MENSRKKVFLFILLSRLLLLLGFCLLISLTVWILFIINGFTGIDAGKLIIYCLVSFLMLEFFLLVGMAASSLKTKGAGIVAVFAVWLLFVFFVPAAVGKIVYNQANNILSTYEMELEKFKLMMEIEKKAKDQAGKLDAENTNTEIRRKLYEYFWNNEFKEILDKEQSMINEMKGVISLHHNLSLVFPTSFFLSVNNEISGRGYETLICFYEHVYKLKRGFIQYYAEKSFYSGEKTVTPFLKGDENIFNAPGLLPANFGFGLLISFFWLLLLLFLSGISFDRMLDRARETGKEINPDQLKQKMTNIIFTSDKGIKPQLIRKLRFKKIAFVSVPTSGSLPGDAKVKNLFSLFGLAVPVELQEISGKYIYNLDPDDKGRVLLEIAGSFKTDVLIFDNFLTGLSDDFINYFTGVLNTSKKDKTVAYITNSLKITSEIGDYFIRFNEEKPIY